MTREEYKKLHSGVAFMDERKKGDFSDLQGETITLDEWAEIKTKDGKALVFTCEEDDKTFYFANSVMYEMIKEIDDIHKGDRFSIGKKTKSKNNNWYYPVTLED